MVEPEVAVTPQAAVPEQAHDMSAAARTAKNRAHEVHPRSFPGVGDEMWIFVEGLTDLRVEGEALRFFELIEEFFSANDHPTNLEARLECDPCEVDFGERETLQTVLLYASEASAVP